jgi:ATPase subunit of ABC transporter with duplicated ATPase domains
MIHKMILTLENLTKSYGEKLLFSHVDLAIEEGDKIGIVGVNGTGKSTFLKAAAGMIPVDEGDARRAEGAAPRISRAGQGAQPGEHRARGGFPRHLAAHEGAAGL